jgi:nitrate reductase delta subunit
MLIFKVISVLLSYPQAEVLENLDEIAAAVEQEADLPSAQKTGLAAFIDAYRDRDLIEWQQQYVECFDRGRSLSLLMFEHVHGESRDRGQAMVDLLQVYQSHGFEIAARELPDHVPLFLEFLSQLPKNEALELLRGALPVLNRLGGRLAERNSPYAVLFDGLAALAGETEGLDASRKQAAAEGPDETLTRMDEIWEEEAVSFLGNPQACPSHASQSPHSRVASGNEKILVRRMQ